MSSGCLVRGSRVLALITKRQKKLCEKVLSIRSFSSDPADAYVRREYIDFRPGVYNAKLISIRSNNATVAASTNSGLGGSTDFELIFLGTASAIPSFTRNTSCLAVRYQSVQWLVDCGEGSQRQISASIVQGKRITNIFITHLHGDHCFGLPGVLCMIGKDILETQSHVVNIYGPQGLRDYLRVVLQNVRARVCARYRVHELHGLPPFRTRIASAALPMDSSFGEVEGGRDIFPNQHLEYDLGVIDGIHVSAASMVHTIPCVGYVFNEPKAAGRLRIEDAEEIVERNRAALPALINHEEYKYVYRVLKNLSPDESFTFPDGTVVSGRSIVDPPRPGRKVVVMGDTRSGKYIADLAQDADVLVHEATNAYFNDVDSTLMEEKFDSYDALKKHTCDHGHSTPEMAGAFGKSINAKQLLLTHFSSRYSPSRRVVGLIENMARNAFCPLHKHNVIAAYDYMGYIVEKQSRSDSSIK